MRIVRTLRQQWIGILGVLIGLAGVGYGATGQPAVLGTINKADKTTVFQNTSTGPAATFNVKSGQAPFKVSSPVMVPKLNAARLGGKRPSAFTPAGSSYTKAQSDGRYIDTGEIDSYHTKAAADAKFIDTTEIGSYYTKTQADAAFAPATGSSQYLPAAHLQLYLEQLSDQQDPTTAGATTIKTFSVVTPGAGRVTARIWGFCDQNGSSVGSLTMQVSAVSDGRQVAGSGVACELSVSYDAPASEGVGILIQIESQLSNEVKLLQPTIVVTYQP